MHRIGTQQSMRDSELKHTTDVARDLASSDYCSKEQVQSFARNASSMIVVSLTPYSLKRLLRVVLLRNATIMFPIIMRRLLFEMGT